MKKILAFIILSVAMVSCYEDYILDHTFTGVYFPYQMDVRTIVVGEGMKIQVGAALGGVRENKVDREVIFEFDNSLITPALLAKMKAAPQNYIKNAAAAVTLLEPLPGSHYTISNATTMVIKAGQHMGSVTIKADSIAFCTDSAKTKISTYVLPFKITDADADSIIEPKKTNMVGLIFEHKFFGNYWHGGAAVVNRPGNPRGDTTIVYKTTIPTAEAKIWPLTTQGPSTLLSKGYLSNVSTKNEMILTVKGDKINITSAPGSTYTYLPDGESKFNGAKLLQNRKLILKYMYTDPVSTFTYHCTDTLTFRNRVRDGINEWQDENPSNYSK
jgi:hypothetical protein